MSDQEYRELAVGDNRGNIITYKVDRDLVEGRGLHAYTVRHNGVVVAQGLAASRGAATDKARARIQRFTETGSWEAK